MRLVIISGRSGSGKTVALHVLEDLGFYCIDNLPIALLPELNHQIGGQHKNVAVSIDARNIPSDLKQFKQIIENFKSQGNTCEILYLDANENVLLKRFSETRRKHPLTSDVLSLREAIQHEHQLLTPIAALADLSIDSSNLNRQTLQTLIRDRFVHPGGSSLQLLLQSFGFKHGLPSDADFIFDVRCLPNPYWDPELRSLSGRDKRVMDFLMKEPSVNQMIEDIYLFLKKWIPKFQADNRSYVTIALGCTGGQHRSVFMVEGLSHKLENPGLELQVRHRDESKN